MLTERPDVVTRTLGWAFTASTNCLAAEGFGNIMIQFVIVRTPTLLGEERFEYIMKIFVALIFPGYALLSCVILDSCGSRPLLYHFLKGKHFNEVFATDPAACLTPLIHWTVTVTAILIGRGTIKNVEYSNHVLHTAVVANAALDAMLTFLLRSLLKGTVEMSFASLLLMKALITCVVLHRNLRMYVLNQYPFNVISKLCNTRFHRGVKPSLQLHHV